MIGFMPDFYPDELVYSLLARYYQRSGYLAYRYAAKELFEDPSARQDMYFLPRLTSGARTVLTKGASTEALIERHTMFPCFCRFLPVERRGKAFRAMMAMEGKYDSLVAMPNRKPGLERSLRYCPECAKEDREKYGETYWHRCAQIHDIGVCPRHGCQLVDSKVIISGRMPPMLTTAEESVPEDEAPVSCDSKIQMQLAGYMTDAFAASLALDNPTPVGDFLHSKMAWTKYRSVRGEQRNIALLAHDFEAYYRSLPGNDFYEDWQLQKVLNNNKPTFKYVCMVAMFLNIRIEELADMSLPEKTQEQLFDEQVRKLHEAGMKYPAIAEHVGAPYDLVKAIGEGRYGTYHKPSRIQQKCGQRELDWEALDRETLPRVQAYIGQKRSAASGKPSRITLNSVEQALISFMKSYVAKKPTESSKRTRRTIGRTFLDIASEVPFSKVSVREICNRMGITRTAFYYHFDDVYSVLDDILKNMAEECCIDDLFISWAEKRIGGPDIPCKAAMDRIRLFTVANECSCLLNDVMLAGYLIDYVIKRETEYVVSRFANDSGLSEAEAEQLFRFTFAGMGSLYCGRRQEKQLADMPFIYPKGSVSQRRYSI